MRYIVILSFSMLFVLACNRSQSPAKSNAQLVGYKAFQKNCSGCHGADGKSGGAKNLTTSTLDKTAIVQIVTKGKGRMPAYEGKLSTNDIDSIADYLMTLRP
jgi:cytochrome c6